MKLAKPVDSDGTAVNFKFQFNDSSGLGAPAHEMLILKRGMDTFFSTLISQELLKFDCDEVSASLALNLNTRH